MAKFLSFAAVAALLVASTVAHEGHSESSEAAVTKECAANVTTAALAVVDNSTYLNSCSPGSTWKLTNLFEAANLSASDFLTFCNATECMHPMHELLEVLPEDCVSTYNGVKVVFADKIDAIHDKCHKLLNGEKEEAEGSEGSHHDDDDHDEDAVAGSKSNSTATAGASSSVPTPAPSKSSASVSSKSLAALISVTAAVAALVL